VDGHPMVSSVRGGIASGAAASMYAYAKTITNKKRNAKKKEKKKALKTTNTTSITATMDIIIYLSIIPTT